METPATRPSASWSRRDMRQAFGQLSAPDPRELAGRWDAELVGRPALRRLAAAVFALSPMRGWCGKGIAESGDVRNLVRRGSTLTEIAGATVARGPSMLDGRPAAVVEYSQMASPLLRRAHGELRWLRPDVELLGVLYPFGSRLIGPFPYVMTRSHES